MDTISRELKKKIIQDFKDSMVTEEEISFVDLCSNFVDLMQKSLVDNGISCKVSSIGSHYFVLVHNESIVTMDYKMLEAPLDFHGYGFSDPMTDEEREQYEYEKGYEEGMEDYEFPCFSVAVKSSGHSVISNSHRNSAQIMLYSDDVISHENLFLITDNIASINSSTFYDLTKPVERFGKFVLAAFFPEQEK